MTTRGTKRNAGTGKGIAAPELIRRRGEAFVARSTKPTENKFKNPVARPRRPIIVADVPIAAQCLPW
jgi:hypothetical protein